LSDATKDEAERDLDAAWGEVRSVVESLSDDEALEAGVVDIWSVKDLVGHMAYWADKAAVDLNLAAAGRFAEIEVPGGESQVTEWNAREAAAREGKSLDAIKREWAESFQSAKAALAATPAEVLDVNVKGWTMFVRFAEDTYLHYREHAEQIQVWQREMETTEA
jgi:hypothetical protein